MNSDREPASSPAPRRVEEELDNGEISDSNCEESYTPADGSEGKDDDSDARDDDDDDDDDDDNDHNDSDIPSSPPTSVETGSKNDQRAGGAAISNDGYRAPAVETEDEEDVDAPREYFTHHYETANDTFSAHRKNWENSSQWEDEDGSPTHATRASPPPARVQSQSSSRKSPAPSSPMFPPRPRQTGSTKSHLSHQFTHRHSPASRASSGSYEARELHRDEKKPPLVLLHVTLLLLSGAEEVVLRHLTPTTLERGVLIEHPRGDYNLLEELILDGLGLDDDFVSDPTEAEEPAEKTWEQALNIMPNLPAKKAWQLRVYASNGLMTPGAWKRVWAEMERIDVEIWPRGYDRNGRSTRSPIGGGHSRGTSTSSVLPYQGDSGAAATDEPGYVDRRKSLIGATAVRHGSGASSVLALPTSPAPTKARRMRSRAPAAAAGFELNKLLTPRAVMVYAGINMLLFLYFTVFRFVDFGGAWSSSVAMFRAGEMEGVLVQEVEERRSAEASTEGCGVVEAVVEVEAVEVEIDGVMVEVETYAEERVLADDEASEENVSDPEISSEHHDQVPLVEDVSSYELEEGAELDVETSSDGTTEGEVQLDLEEASLEQSEDLVVEEETEADEEPLEESHEAGLDVDGDAETAVQDEIEAEAEGEAEGEAGEEAEEAGVEAEAEEVKAEEVEEKPKFGFLKGFGFS